MLADKTKKVLKLLNFLTFVDYYSYKTFVYFLRHISKVIESVHEFIKCLERQTGNKILSLRADSGKEYGSKSFKIYLKQQKIGLKKTVPYTLRKNWISNLTNSVMLDTAFCMMQCMYVLPFSLSDAIAKELMFKK